MSNLSNKTLLWIAAVLIVVAGAAYWYENNRMVSVTPEQQAQTTSGTQQSGNVQPAQSGIANPASVNCVTTLGGTLEIVDDAVSGGQVGYCHLQDGRVCEEWSLMRGGCTAPVQ